MIDDKIKSADLADTDDTDKYFPQEGEEYLHQRGRYLIKSEIRKIRREMKKRGITSSKMAERLGYQTTSIGNFLNPLRRKIGYLSAVSMFLELGCSEEVSFLVDKSQYTENYNPTRPKLSDRKYDDVRDLKRSFRYPFRLHHRSNTSEMWTIHLRKYLNQIYDFYESPPKPQDAASAVEALYSIIGAERREDCWVGVYTCLARTLQQELLDAEMPRKVVILSKLEELIKREKGSFK